MNQRQEHVKVFTEDDTSTGYLVEKGNFHLKEKGANTSVPFSL
jgi:hypothetical protein